MRCCCCYYYYYYDDDDGDAICIVRCAAHVVSRYCLSLHKSNARWCHILFSHSYECPSISLKSTAIIVIVIVIIIFIIIIVVVVVFAISVIALIDGLSTFSQLLISMESLI